MKRLFAAAAATAALVLTGCSAPSSFDGYVHAECDPTDANKVTVCRSTEMPVPTVTQTVTATPAPSPTQTATVTKVNDTAFTFTGTWATTTGNALLFNGDNRYSNTTNNSWSYTFNGTKIQWYGEKNVALGIVGVSIDGGPEQMIDPYATSRTEQNLLYTSADLPSGSHTLKVRITGQKNAASTGTYASADRVDVTSFSGATTPPPAAQGIPAFNKIVVAIFENQSYNDVMNQAPYLKSLATTGANLTNMHGNARPSQPNYLHLFSGSAWGQYNNDVPVRNWMTENLAHQLIQQGKKFHGYSEGLPYAGYLGGPVNGYEPKHAPWVNWANYPQADVGKPLTEFPSDFNQLPNVSFVVGDRCNSMHDCSIATGDNWARNKLDAYKQWAANNNSLLVITFDEGAISDSSNHMFTALNGARVKPGYVHNNWEDLNDLLGMMQDAHNLPRTEGSINSGASWSVMFQ